MSLRKPALFLLGIFTGVAPVSFGVDTLPSHLRVILPPIMAARMAQDSIGVALPNGDSRVQIPLKAPFNATVENVVIKNVPDTVKMYGSKIFGLNFENPFNIDIRVFGLKPSGDVRVKSVRFAEAPRRDDRIAIDVELEIRHLKVETSKIWVVERGLTPTALPGARLRCPVPAAKLDSFVKDQVGARVLGANISENSHASGEIPVTVKGRFEATYSARERGMARELRLSAVSLVHNLTEVIDARYRLQADFEVPPVIVFQAGECDEIGNSRIKMLFNGMLDSIKRKVTAGVADTITETALKQAAKAFAKLNLPVEKVIEAPAVTEQKSAGSKLVTSIVTQYRERLLLGGLSATNRGGLGLELGDQLTLNSRTEAEVPSVNEGVFPSQASDQFRMVFNRSFFTSKVNLLESLRPDWERLLPPGIVLSQAGVDVHGNSGNRLSLVAHVEIHLKRLKGIVGIAASLIERFAGNTDGIYRLPLQVNLLAEVLEVAEVRPELLPVVDLLPRNLPVSTYVRKSPQAELEIERARLSGSVEKSNSEAKPLEAPGIRVLRLNLELHEDFIQNAFGDRSNLDQGASLIVKKVKEKLREFAAKLKAKPIDIELAPLETKAPVKLNRVVFSDRGSLAIDLELTTFRGVITKKKRAGVKP